MIKKIFIFSLILVFSLSWSDFQFVHSAKWVKHGLHFTAKLKTHITKQINSKYLLQSCFINNSEIIQSLFLKTVQDIGRLIPTKLYILYCELKFEVTTLPNNGLGVN
ncbi:MAG: hypothetical protein A2X64_05880 [Ignavibacteria bacterium GWF2_33_9]|nr:MAG: hypothetical protein A2X64_05880 [Ignavibacteria bacterium GWF2_33_9]